MILTANTLRAWRLSAGLTRHELAKKIDEHAGSLAKAESGGVVSQYVCDEVEKLAGVMGIPVPDEATAIGFIQKYSDGAVDKRQKGGDTRPKGVDLAPVEIKVKPTAKAEIKKMGDDTMRHKTADLMNDPKQSGATFTQARNNKGMSTAQISEATGIPKATIQGYACGKPTPVAKFEAIMEAIGDFTPGEQPAKPARKSSPSKKKGTGAKPDPESAKILRDMRDSTGITVKQVSKETGMGKSSIQNYLKGSHPIPDDKFSAIVKAFDTLKPEVRTAKGKSKVTKAIAPGLGVSKDLLKNQEKRHKATKAPAAATTPAKTQSTAKAPESDESKAFSERVVSNMFTMSERFDRIEKMVANLVDIAIMEHDNKIAERKTSDRTIKALETLDGIVKLADRIPVENFNLLIAAYEAATTMDIE